MMNLEKGRVFISAVILCVSTAAATPVLAGDIPDSGNARSIAVHHEQRPQACHGPRMGSEYRRHWSNDRFWRALKKLDLTEKQKASIHQIRFTMMKDMIQKQADLRVAHMELREQLRKDSVEMRAVESQVKKLEGLKTAMMLDAINAREAIKSTLTPDQQKKLAELMHGSRGDGDSMRPKG